MSTAPRIDYPYGSICWQDGIATVHHRAGDRLHTAYLTDYQARCAYPSRHLSGEYAMQVLLPGGAIGLNPQLQHHCTENGTLVLTLADPRYPQLALTLSLILEEEGVFRQQVSITNGLTESILLLRAYSLAAVLQEESYHLTNFRGVWAGEHLLTQQEVQRGTTLSVGATSGIKTTQEGTPGLMITCEAAPQEESGHTLLAALCWSGNYTLSFTHNANGGGYLGLGHDFGHAPYTLAPGQKIELPEAILLSSRQGKGGCTRALHRYVRRCILPHGEHARRTLLNSWEGVHFDVHQPTLEAMMARTAELGIDMFVLDDGWFGKRKDDTSSLGDWYADAEKLPQGLTPLTKHAQALGISFGLWMEPEMVCPNSELYRTHPDWAIQLPGLTPTEQRHQLMLNLANPEVEAYITAAVARVLEAHQGISYIKWDCNRMLTDAPHPNIYFDYIRAYYRIMSALRCNFPHVTFQCCSAGGGRMDLGAARFHEEFWLSDNTDAHDRLRMQWGASHFFPANAVGAHVTASPNLYTGRRTSLKFRFDVALAGRLGFELDPRTLSDEDSEEIRARLALYKELAPITQLGDLYRLRSPYEGTDCALLYTDGQQAVLLAYTTERLFTQQHTRLKAAGLHPAKLYRVQELMPDTPHMLCAQHGCTMSGEELMHGGLNIRWNRPLQSCVILLTPCE